MSGPLEDLRHELNYQKKTGIEWAIAEIERKDAEIAKLRAAFKQFTDVHEDMSATVTAVNEVWERTKLIFEQPQGE